MTVVSIRTATGDLHEVVFSEPSNPQDMKLALEAVWMAACPAAAATEQQRRADALMKTLSSGKARPRG